MAAGSSSSCSLLLLLVAAAVLSSSLPYAANAGGSSRHLTAGFSRVKLNESQFVVQKPYDLPLHDRYDPCGGVRRFWVFATDKPINSTRPGYPRTEIKVDKVYSSGVWQFEGDVYVPWGTSGASVMQIFGANKPHASTVMLPVYDGKLTYYHNVTKVLADRVYDRWMRLNVVHDVAAGNVAVFVDGERRLDVRGHGGKEHYFKFGVYTQGLHNHSHRMEAHWKNVAIYTKP
ncbi:citrate-binding protein [Sorghum bicolor]|uniref:Alginate lyase 2 domain-containing protein n=1 Tax=Sorghum bicolor TaxID=4558 RepID=C5Y5I8_SORBI|nr:citrate-binding protein [Sorghum bicolor]EES09339.1 hypothetical protein SORBI_3005G050100 [Sorghum bicolor]|eukprot:XP_002450351.1 citrate-binding protein [Sorghum bicolor]